MIARPWRGLKNALAWGENQAGWLLLGGVAAAVVANGLQWRRDRRLAREWRARRAEVPELPAAPRVSILLPAWNEAAHLAACIGSVLALRYPAVELVVCAGGSDGTLEIAQNYSNRGVIVLEQRPGEGKQRALQRCFERSTGEIIFLTDADCVVNDHCFESTIALLIIGEEEVATGFWEPLETQKHLPFVQYQWAHHIYREIHMPMHADTLDGRNAAVRRDALIRTAALQADAPIGTDYVLSRQLIAAGYQIRAIHGSRVQTEYPATYENYRRQQSRWLRNRLVLGAQTGSRRDIIVAVRAGAASLLLLVAPLFGMLGIWPVWVPWSSGALHAMLAQVRITSSATASDIGWPGRVRPGHLLVYFALSSVVMARGLLDCLLPARRWRW